MQTIYHIFCKKSLCAANDAEAKKKLNIGFVGFHAFRDGTQLHLSFRIICIFIPHCPCTEKLSKLLSPSSFLFLFDVSLVREPLIEGFFLLFIPQYRHTDARSRRYYNGRKCNKVNISGHRIAENKAFGV